MTNLHTVFPPLRKVWIGLPFDGKGTGRGFTFDQINAAVPILCIFNCLRERHLLWPTENHTKIYKM